MEEFLLDLPVDHSDPGGKVREVMQTELIDDLLALPEELSEEIELVFTLVQSIDRVEHQAVQTKDLIDLARRRDGEREREKEVESLRLRCTE